MTKKYILFLISPKQRFVNYPAQTELARIFGKKRFMIPLALPTLAALTPDNYEIHIYDEEIESLPAGIKPDIVGITTLAATVKRAFELGDKYRIGGAKVVYGGPYASYRNEEALEHGDSVVVGEAENLWEELLSDFEKCQLKTIYQSTVKVSYKTQRPPRWDLVNMKRIFQVAIQVSRGCPFNCDFCLVSKTFGRVMRYRDIDNVVEEIKAAPSRYFFFVDDNLTINKKYARELMRALIPLKISWGCMCSIDVAKDEELLRLMAEAGCFNILIGFESLNRDSLSEADKHQNMGGEFYEEAVKKINEMGIHINASFVAGFDNDTLDEFDHIFDFTMKNHLPYVNLHILNPTPGTRLYEKCMKEGRLCGYDSDLGVGHFPNMDYANMSQIGLFDAYMKTITRLYSFGVIRQKAEALFIKGDFKRHGTKISTALKVRLSFITLKEFLLTLDSDRRKLFWLVIRLIRSEKLAVDKGLGFLLSILGYHRHIRDHHKKMASYRAMILQRDRGPWKIGNLQDQAETGAS